MKLFKHKHTPMSRIATPEENKTLLKEILEKGVGHLNMKCSCGEILAVEVTLQFRTKYDK